MVADENSAAAPRRFVPSAVAAVGIFLKFGGTD